MKNYKIIRKNQFACSIMQVRRDKKMPVAILKDYDEAIISQAYPVFRIVDETKLLPDYLMMWMSREEFDREACFLAVGGVRGSLEWEDFLNMELPVPSIEKQREIVDEYNTVVDRIELNETINQKLEETAKTIYRQWFEEFEFPISKEYAESIGKPELEGKPYKSSGGEMVYNEELGKEVPKKWNLASIKDFALEMKSGGTPNRQVSEYWNRQDYPWFKTGELKNRVLLEAEEYISEQGLKKSSAKLLPVNAVLIAMYGQGDTKGQIGYLKVPATTNQACCAMIFSNEFRSTYVYYYLRLNRDKIVSVAIGGAQPNLSKGTIEELRLLDPDEKVLLNTPLVKIMRIREILSRELFPLEKMRSLLLSKMTQTDKSILIPSI